MKKYTLLAVILLAVFNPLPSYAASQDECSIWLCLPAGFPSGCGAAKSAFKNRIKHHKSPLPAFSSCAVQSSTKMTFTEGTMIYIPAVTCGYGGSISYAGFGGFGARTPTPAHWQKGGTCPTIGCQTKRYIDVKVDGQNTGSTFMY